MPSYRSEVIGPPPFSARSSEYQIETLRDHLPQRWRSGARDSVESIVGMLAQARDHHLYRKVGSESWADYCTTFLLCRPEAMDALIEGVRILKGQSPEPEAEATRILSWGEAHADAVVAAVMSRKSAKALPGDGAVPF